MADQILPLWVGTLRYTRLPLAVACGVLMATGLAPYELWYLAFAGLIGAFWLFQAAPHDVSGLSTGWAVGFGYFGLALGWIVEPFMVEAAVTGWMAPFALFGMAGGLALFWALAFWCAGRARKRPMLALVVTWAGAELARAYVLTGFPWALVAYIWAPVAPIQWVSIFGAHGLTLVTLAAAALFAYASLPNVPRVLSLTLGSTLVLALFGGGAAMTPAQQDHTNRPIVRLIQPNAAQHEKWDPDMIPIFFNRQLDFSKAPPKIAGSPPDLVVWPETALPMLLENAGETLAFIGAETQAEIVAGIQRGGQGTYYNSLVHVDATGAVQNLYDKHHLVPFGEYMPAAALFRLINVSGLAERADGGYSAGPGPRVIELGALGKALPLICYEAVFPQNLTAAPERPDVLLQITNDAWFGKWSGPQQHFAQARIRAIEQGLPMVRAANTGVSAVIDGAGRVVASLGLGKAGYIDAPVPAPLAPTLYSRTGDIPFVLLLIGCILGLIFAERKIRVEVIHRRG